MKIGSLCSGYGGLDMAVEAFYGAETVWMSDIDKASSKVIAERWQLPNLGDLKTVNWEDVEPVDILTAGYPCQPFSNAGLRKGTNDPRHLWPSIKKIISRIRPGIVILENVKGHLTLGFKEVLQDLTEIGYDAKWQIVRASDAGAPHQRERLFIIAKPNGFNRRISSQNERTITPNPDSEPLVESRRASRSLYESTGEIINRTNRNESGGGVTFAPNSNDPRRFRNPSRLWRGLDPQFEMWVHTTPNPLDQSKLNTKFVEYMMGLPEGWVTDLDLSRSQQFKLLGNGVVPQQAYLALELLND